MGIMKLLGTSFSTILNGGSPTADRTITFPDKDGQVLCDTSTGTILQVQNYTTGAMTTGTGVIPNDDSIPQITEGTEFMTLAFTPKKANSRLRIDIVALVTNNSANYTSCALFRDSTANAIGAMLFTTVPSAGYYETCAFTVFVDAVATTTTTFRFRAGGSGASTVTFNGQSSARIFGGTMASSITVTEIAG